MCPSCWEQIVWTVVTEFLLPAGCFYIDAELQLHLQFITVPQIQNIQQTKTKI